MSIKVQCNGLFALSRKLKKSEALTYGKITRPNDGEGPLPYIEDTQIGEDISSAIVLHDYEGSYGNYVDPTEALNAGKKYLDSIGVEVDPSCCISTHDDEGVSNIVHFDEDCGEFMIDDMEELAVRYLEMRGNHASH